MPGISMNKKYKTVKGFEVCIYTTRGKGEYPVIGQIRNARDGEWFASSWNASGEHSGYGPYSLVEIPIRHKRVVWINADDGGDCALHLRRSDAEIDASPNRVALLRLELDFAEGQFDEEPKAGG